MLEILISMISNFQFSISFSAITTHSSPKLHLSRLFPFKIFTGSSISTHPIYGLLTPNPANRYSAMDSSLIFSRSFARYWVSSCRRYLLVAKATYTRRSSAVVLAPAPWYVPPSIMKASPGDIPAWKNLSRSLECESDPCLGYTGGGI